MATEREEENQRMLEKSSAYKLLAEQWAFKDFMEFISGLKDDAIKRIYDGPKESLEEVRGSLKIIKRIEQELDYLLSFKGQA